MLQKSIIVLLIQTGIKVFLVLGDDHQEQVGNDGSLAPVLLKPVDEGERKPLTNFEGVEDEKIKTEWVFKQIRAKKEVRGFDFTNEEKEKFKIWKDGVIPYYIDVVSFGDKVIRDKIRKHLQMVNSATGVNFIELAKPPDDEKERWVFFINRRALLGCGDHNVKNFTNEGVQRVVLGYDCMSTKGELAEAVMSILGVPAEHNAPKRDDHIKVMMENILPDKKYLFEKLSDKDWLFHDLPYDFNSVTHYDLHKYTANGRATIVPVHGVEDFRPATKYSPSDIRKIKMLYTFIIKKKKMQVSMCEKLFDADKVVKPEKKRIKSRQKPSEYLGIPKQDSKSSSESSSSTENSDEKHENEDKNRPLNIDNPNLETKNSLENDDSNNRSRVIYHSNISKVLEDSDNVTSKNTQKLLKAPSHKTKNKKKVKAIIQSLLDKSDYDSSKDFQRVPLKAPAPAYLRPEDDPMLLSDYQTEERK